MEEEKRAGLQKALSKTSASVPMIHVWRPPLSLSPPSMISAPRRKKKSWPHHTSISPSPGACCTLVYWTYRLTERLLPPTRPRETPGGRLLHLCLQNFHGVRTGLPPPPSLSALQQRQKRPRGKKKKVDTPKWKKMSGGLAGWGGRGGAGQAGWQYAGRGCLRRISSQRLAG